MVEPRLSEQWFVKMAPLAAPALAAYRDGTLRFIPERRGNEYAQWMENIRDWCISRQLWWGHRIPVWYCDSPKCGHVSVSRTDVQACLECGGPVRQDDDVLDTWFSSWLVPFSSLGWPAETPDLERFYPGDTLVTAPGDPLLLGGTDDHGRASSSRARCPSAPSTCTAPCATPSIARCPSRWATASIRWRWWSATAPTRSGTR